MNCTNCKQPVDTVDKFCPHCGNPTTGESKKVEVPKQKKAKTFVSKGNYTGKIVKEKSSRGWKIFRNIIIALFLVGIIALIIWFQVDPDAGKKLTDVLMGIGFMAVFFFIGWIFMRGKKGNRKDNYDWDDDQYTDISDDDDN